VARGVALAASLAVSLVAVTGAGGADVQTPKRGGTVVVSRPAITEPPCLNPFCVDVADPAFTQVLEGAFEIGSDLVPRPNLVSAVTSERNPFTLTYRIRPEARWSDGVPVTARDFQFTHDAFVAHYEDPDGEYANIRRTRVLDAKTFRVELHKPISTWRLLYRVVLPRHALAGEDLTKVWSDAIENPKTGRPIGSGPFLLSRRERGRQITLVRNPGYWGRAAYLDRIVFRFTSPDPRDPLAPLKENEVDLGLTLGSPAALTADAAREIGSLPGWRVSSWPGIAMEHFLFRVGPGGHPGLRLRPVRQALAYGIDRVAIAREIQQGVSAANRGPLDSVVFVPTEPHYRPAWSRYRYDVATSRRLLEQAGCRRDAGGIYECAGERLRLRFVTTSGSEVRERVMVQTAAHLRRVGVEVDAVYAPPMVVFGRILPSGDFDVALFSWVTFAGMYVWPDVLCGHEQNWGGYCSRLVMRDAEQNRIGSLAVRARGLNALDRKLAKVVPVVPVVQPVVRLFHRSNVRGVDRGGSHFEVLEGSEDWWLADSR
jgi:peptide/nickel transport system substrate-binding protein